MNEANVFTIHRTGLKVHWKLVSDTLSDLQEEVEYHANWLSDNGYSPDGMGRPITGNGHAEPDPPAGTPQVKCGLCGGVAVKVTNKPKETSPDWKCSSCGAAAWNRKEGKLSEWRASNQ